MKKFIKIFVVLIAAVSIGGLLGFYFIGDKLLIKKEEPITTNASGKVAGVTTVEHDYDSELAKKLKDSGVVLYGSYQSQETIAQKKLFGDAASYLNYVECDASGESANPDECAGVNVDVYPSWFYKGKLYTGVQSLAELANMINFSR